MSQNPFKMDAPTPKPNRNSFDLSFANNLSFNIGKLIPVFCKETIPGDTFYIDSTFGLRLMPMVFPTQTRLKASLSFFYVPNRILWKHWRNFIRGEQEYILPYISGNEEHMRKLFENGNLADYLGCPTAVAEPFVTSSVSQIIDYGSVFSTYGDIKLCMVNNAIYKATSYQNVLYQLSNFRQGAGMTKNCLKISSLIEKPVLNTTTSNISLHYNGAIVNDPDNNSFSAYIIILKDNTVYTNTKNNIDPIHLIDGDFTCKACSTEPLTFTYNTDNGSYESATLKDVKFNWKNGIAYTIDQVTADCPYRIGVCITGIDMKNSYFKFMDTMAINGIQEYSYNENANFYVKGEQKINALPFRAYEAIYNAIYRNTVNDPFMKDNKPNYDEYCTTYEDGADTTDYHIFNSYWEKDFLTTALPSPQQGNAPLLGFSSTSAPGTSANANYEMSYTSEDGTTHRIRIVRNASNGTLTFSSPTAAPDGGLQGDIDVLNNATQFGISINDLRNVNSLQRWLEKAIVNGYKYKDVIRAHFGIELSLRELEMPEFLGGFTRDIQINAITQTSPSEETPLGWQAGQAGVFGNSDHNISRYCEEHGYIIGIMQVYPIPTYTQLMPKHFLKRGILDFFTPEFAHIGNQPVPLKEVAPLQAEASNLSQEKVFAYQRAWYDYLASTDEAHGEFRASLMDFLIMRTFSASPELGHDFLTIDNTKLNDVFSVTAGKEHKIYGQIYFKVNAERPIPLFNEPRLE